MFACRQTFQAFHIYISIHFILFYHGLPTNLPKLEGEGRFYRGFEVEHKGWKSRGLKVEERELKVEG